MKYEITFHKHPEVHELQVLANGIDRFTESHLGPDDRRELVFFYVMPTVQLLVAFKEVMATTAGCGLARSG